MDKYAGEIVWYPPPPWWAMLPYRLFGSLWFVRCWQKKRWQSRDIEMYECTVDGKKIELRSWVA